MAGWFEQTVLDGLKELDEERGLPGWFSVSAVSSVPYVSYPFLSDEQNREVYEQAKQVLILSRTQNQYKETSITYNVNDPVSPEKYVKVFGDVNSIRLMDNEEIRLLITKQNENGNLVVISLHNHPNSSGFSAMDILVFANNPSIRIMEIINTKGEIAILARPFEIDLRNEMSDILAINIPNLAERIKKCQDTGCSHRDDISLVDVSSIEERHNIVNDCLNTFTNIGVFYSDYIDQGKAERLKLTPLKNISDIEIREERAKDIKPLSSSTVNSERRTIEEDDYER